MKKFIFIVFLVITFVPAYSQDEMTVIPDSAHQGQFLDYVGLRLIVEDFGLHSINENLKFSYTSINTGYVMSHSMDVRGISNTPNIGFGLEEDINKHLFIDFFDVTIGYIQNTLNWNAGAGIGYYVNLNAKRTLYLRGYLSVFYENISYSLGSYTDTTLLGLVVNDQDIGTYVNDVRYVNSLLCVSPSLELSYRRENWDYFIGIGFNYTLLTKEDIDFYRTNIPINQGLYDNSNNPVNKGVITPGSYIIKIGLIKEFGF
jgi:hypothetical protein